MIWSGTMMNATCEFCLASAWSLCYAIQISAPVLHHHSIKLYMSCICSLTTVSNHVAELCWVLYSMQSVARSTIKVCPQRVFCTLMYELWVCSASLERAFGLLLAELSLTNTYLQPRMIMVFCRLIEDSWRMWRVLLHQATSYHIMHHMAWYAL